MERLDFVVGFTFVTVLLLSGIILYLKITADRLCSDLKDLRANQFDAEEVMKMYQQKFNRPVVLRDRADVIELRQDFRYPYEVHKQLNHEELDDYISDKLCKGFTDEIKHYIEYETDYDITTNQIAVYSRLRIIKPEKH